MFTFLLVFGFLAAWVALYIFVIRPKLVAYQYTAGIYAKLDTLEAGWWSWIKLRLQGLKVLIAGFVTSSAPIVAVFYDKISGLDWTQFLASETAKIMAGVVAALGIVGPMLMVAMHNHALADAAATEPVNK